MIVDVTLPVEEIYFGWDNENVPVAYCKNYKNIYAVCYISNADHDCILEQTSDRLWCLKQCYLFSKNDFLKEIKTIDGKSLSGYDLNWEKEDSTENKR